MGLSVAQNALFILGHPLKTAGVSLGPRVALLRALRRRLRNNTLACLPLD